MYDSYGQKCNHRFLLNYGFAVEDNTEPDGFCPNEVPIALSMREDDPLYHLRYEFWMRGEQEGSNFSSRLCSSDPRLSAIMSLIAGGSGNVNGSNTNVDGNQVTEATHNDSTTPSHNDDSTPPLVRRVRVCISNNENTRILFSLLRVLVASHEELKAMTTSQTVPFGDSGCSVYLSRVLRGSNPVNQNSQDNSSTFMTVQRAAFIRTFCKDIRYPISLSNEKAALALLLEVVSSALASYPTTLSQDRVDLMNEVAYPKFSNRRHAKIQVKGEKEVLHHFAFWAQTAINVIGVIENELKSEECTKNTVSTGFDEIIQDMEDDDDIHFTVLRYCRDILGALRKDAVESARQKRAKIRFDGLIKEIT